MARKGQIASQSVDHAGRLYDVRQAASCLDVGVWTVRDPNSLRPLTTRCLAEEVIAHLVGQVGADVTVSLEIAADLPKGVSDQVVRTVTENSLTLKVDTHGFEKD